MHGTRGTNGDLRRIGLTAWIVAGSVAAGAAGAAGAVVGDCKPVTDAQLKMYRTPVHLTTTKTNGVGGEPRTVGELIYLDGVTYLKTNGVWKRSPVKPEQMLAQEKENIATAKSYTCRHLRDESVDGERAAVWSSHAVTDVTTSDVTIWISITTGLPLRQEGDVAGAGGKSHFSSRYDYRDVRAPAGVR